MQELAAERSPRFAARRVSKEPTHNLVRAGYPSEDIMVVDGIVYVGRDAAVSLAASREIMESRLQGRSLRRHPAVDRQPQPPDHDPRRIRRAGARRQARCAARRPAPGGGPAVPGYVRGFVPSPTQPEIIEFINAPQVISV